MAVGFCGLVGSGFSLGVIYALFIVQVCATRPRFYAKAPEMIWDAKCPICVTQEVQKPKERMLAVFVLASVQPSVNLMISCAQVRKIVMGA